MAEASHTVKIVFETAGLEKVISSVETLGIKFTKVSARLEELGRRFQRTGRVLSVEVTAPLTALGISAVKEAVKIDTAWRRVEKVFEGTADQIRQELIPAAKELALKWGVSQAEVAQVMEEFAALGFKTQDIIDGTTRSLELQRLGNLDLSRSMELTVALMQNYGARGEELNQIIADLNAVEDAGAARLNDMALSIGRVASISKEFGLDVKKLGALMSVLIGRGENANLAARSLRTIFSRLLAPTKALKDTLDKLGIGVEQTVKKTQTLTRVVGQNKDEMKRLERRIRTTEAAIRDYEAGSRGANLTDEERKERIEDLKKSLAVLRDQYNKAKGTQETYTAVVDVGTGKLKSADQVLLELAKKWKTLTEAERNEIATVIAGRNHVDRFIKIMQDLSSEQSEYSRIVEETSDPLTNMIRKQNALTIEAESARVKFGQLAERLREIKIILGNELIPEVIKITDKIIELAENFERLDPSTRKLVIRFGMLLAALGPFFIVLGLIIQGIGGIGLAISFTVKSLIFFSGVLKVLAAGIAAITGLSTGWVVALVAITVAIGAVVYYVRTHWETMSEIIHTKVEEIKTGVGSLIESIRQFFTVNLPQIFNQVLIAISGFVNTAVNFFISMSTNIVNSIATFWLHDLPYLFGFALGVLLVRLPLFVAQAVLWFTQLGTNIVTEISTWPDRFNIWLLAMEGKALATIGSMAEQFQNKIFELGSVIMAEVATWPDRFINWLSSLPQKLANLLNLVYKTWTDNLDKQWKLIVGFKDKVVGAFNAIVDAAMRAVRTIGAAFTEGFRHGAGFQHGGIVPGPVGEPVPIIAHGGERVVPRTGVDVNRGGGGGTTININFNGTVMMDDESRTKELADRILKILGRQSELARYGTGY